jgi:hypothetical protein
MLRDETEVQEQTNRRLLLVARGRPFGHATIELELHPSGEGTEVTMREELRGPVGWLAKNPLVDALVRRRNTEAVARLSALVERRTTPAED